MTFLSRLSASAVLFCALVVSTAIHSGCGPTQRPLTIKIWEFPRWRERADALDRFYWLKQQITAFEALHPGVSVELTELSWEHGEDKKRISVVAGVGPDIITGTLPVQLVEQGLVEAVGSYMTEDEKNDFFPVALDAFTYKGKLYGWPWYLTGSAMFLNLDLFETHGVEPPLSDWTCEDFIKIANQLTMEQRDRGRSRTYGFAFLVRPGDTSVWPFLFPEGLQLSENTRSLTGLFESRKGLSLLSDLIYKERVAPRQCAAWDAETLWQRFTNQRDIAMAPWGIWAIPKLRSLSDFRFGVAPYPSPSGQTARAFTGTSGFVILRQSDPRRREICMEFARFLVRPDEQHQLALYGVFPSRVSAGNIYGGDDVMSRTQAIIAGGQSVPKHSQWQMLDERIQREFQLALLEEKPVHRALNDSIASVREILEKSSDAEASAKGKTGPNYILVFIPMLLLSGIAFIFFVILYSRRRHAPWASAYAFICPALVLFAVFMLFPLCWVVSLTFQEYSIAGGETRWVGMRNLVRVLDNPVFIRATLNTLLYSGVVVPVNVLSALLVASLIYPLSDRMRSFFRGAYYLPGVTSVVVIAMVWRWMFNENVGVLNSFLGFLGLPGVRWLTNPDVALWSVILTSIARPPGGAILIYLAALDAIPSSLYEAGKIDGAGSLRRWWHITVPLLRPATLFLALTITIASFQVFTQVFILTDGGPGYSTEVLVHRIYTTAIRDFDFGIASAMSLLLFCIIMIVSAIQYRFFRTTVEY